MGINRVCSNRPIRADYLDDLVWSQVVELLENPEVIRTEIDRRVQQAQQSNPTQVRKEALVKEQIRIKSGMDRLLDAYQEGLLPLTDLRQRMPELKKREAALSAELESLETNFINQQQQLQLTENLEELMKRLHQSANSLSLADRQKVLRLIVKEILVSPEGITIKHSIPIAQKGDNSQNYQLHTDRQKDRQSGLRMSINNLACSLGSHFSCTGIKTQVTPPTDAAILSITSKKGNSMNSRKLIVTLLGSVLAFGLPLGAGEHPEHPSASKEATKTDKADAKKKTAAASETKKDASATEPLVLCGKCGQVKGGDQCCKADSQKCAKCGWTKSSPACCKITRVENQDDVTLCRKCGEVSGSDKCCKLEGRTKCAQCGLLKGAPGCCQAPAKTAPAAKTGHPPSEHPKSEHPEHPK